MAPYRTVGLTSRLKGSTTNEETVNVGLLAQLATVLLIDAATVQNAGLVGNLVADVGLEPLADGLVDLLGLLGCGDLAGADGPDGLVGNNDLAPVGDLGAQSLELAADDLDGLASLALLQALAAAPDDAQAVLGGVLGLGGDDLVGLVENGAALRVTQDGPCDVAVLELGDGDLAGEGAVGLVEDVLGGDLDLGTEVLTGEEQVDCGRGDDNLCAAMVSMHILLQDLEGPLDLVGTDEPTDGSREALLRLVTISLMDEMVPFLVAGSVSFDTADTPGIAAVFWWGKRWLSTVYGWEAGQQLTS